MFLFNNNLKHLVWPIWCNPIFTNAWKSRLLRKVVSYPLLIIQKYYRISLFIIESQDIIGLLNKAVVLYTGCILKSSGRIKDGIIQYFFHQRSWFNCSPPHPTSKILIQTWDNVITLVHWFSNSFWFSVREQRNPYLI